MRLNGLNITISPFDRESDGEVCCAARVLRLIARHASNNNRIPALGSPA